MYDYNQNPESYTPPEQRSGMETASIVLGILSFIGSACCYVALPLSAVGILLAILSKGHNQRMSSRAKSGLWCSIISLVLTVGMTGYTMYQYRDLFTSPDFQEKMKNYMEYYYSDDKDGEDFLDEFFNDRENKSGNDSYDDRVIPYGGDDTYDGSSPYVQSPYDSYWGTTPYSGGQNSGSVSPGPEL